MGKTKTKTMYDYVNEYVKLFLDTNKVSDGVVENWTSDENQSALEKMIKGTKKKEDKKEEKKKNKVSGQPKKPKSAYICFCDEKREYAKERFPDSDNREIMVRLGELWREISDDSEKTKEWRLKAEEDKKRYDKEMSAFREAHPEQVKKDPVKKAMSAYVLFSNDQRKVLKQSSPDLDPKEVMSKLGELWKAASNDVKDKYAKLAADEKERYKRESDESVTPKESEPEPEPEPKVVKEDVIEEEIVEEEKPKKKASEPKKKGGKKKKDA